MKNILILFTLLLCCCMEISAQSVPEGMRFQAVARDLGGTLLQEQKLLIQVELLAPGAQDKIYYTEKHTVRSSELGMVDFVIGEGSSKSGKFSKIPWSKEELWIRVSIKTPDDDDYQIVSAGLLYSVPYAQYATSAGSLIENEENASRGSRGPLDPLDQTAIYWALDGNHNAHKVKGGGPAVLGTLDRVDVTMITTNQPRLIIDWNGQINILVSINFEGDLNIDGNTTLNGSLDVIGMHPAHLSGTLVVDKATILNDALIVNNSAATSLTGSLAVTGATAVKGSTTLENTLDVANMFPTNLTGTLLVDKETTLNTLTVANAASTHLTGALEVDGSMNIDGGAMLHYGLVVTGMSATEFNGTLSVDKVTTLKDALTVSNKAPTHLTGSLDVDGATNLGGDFSVDGGLEVSGMNPTTLTGTLEVEKLATLEGGLTVSGGGSVGPGGSHVAYFENESGSSADGIAIKLANTQISKLNNYMTFYRGSTVAGRIEGYTTGDLDEIPLPTSDEIWSVLCVGLADYNPLTIVWTQTAGAFNLVSGAWNSTTIPAFDIPDIPAFNIPDVPALTIPNVPAFVITDVPGFTIPDIPGVTIPNLPGLTIGPLLCTNICFCPCSIDITDWNCCCEDVCLIPGSFSVWPEINIPDFPGIAIPDFPGIPIPDFPGFDIPDFPGIAIPDFPGLVIPAVPEINLAEVFGECPTLPTFSDILIDQGVCPDEDIFDVNDGYLRRLADWAFENRLQSLVSADPLKLLANGLAWGLTTAALENGTVYGSKGADYAEYLPKVYASEQFMNGEVVGIHNGRISKNTTNADQVLAITAQPLVLGNMPASGNADDMEKVAFLGQIPVFVKGPVHLGDYIIPSGHHDGIALAISSASVTADMLSSVIGTAWTAYEGDGVTMINTSIGLRPMEITQVLKMQNIVEDELQTQVQDQRTSSDQLIRDLSLIKRAVYNP